MRWCAKFERADHPGKILVNLCLGIPRDFERFIHDLGPVITDRA